jgi:ABC-type dipeptide/oligopeptide/nickel transport system permease component
LILTLSSLIVAYLFGVLAGAWLAWKRGSWIERAAVPVVLATRAAPEFWIGMVLLALLVTHASLGAIAGALAVVGLGVGTFVSPNNSALMGAAPMHRQGIASGVLATARNVGMVLGVGFAGAVFTTVLSRASTPATGLPAAVKASLLAAAVLAAVGTVLSALRPKAIAAAARDFAVGQRQ